VEGFLEKVVIASKQKNFSFSICDVRNLFMIHIRLMTYQWKLLVWMLKVVYSNVDQIWSRINESWIKQTAYQISINEIYDKILKELVLFSTVFFAILHIFSYEVTLIRDQVLINVGAYTLYTALKGSKTCVLNVVKSLHMIQPRFRNNKYPECCCMSSRRSSGLFNNPCGYKLHVVFMGVGIGRRGALPSLRFSYMILIK